MVPSRVKKVNIKALPKNRRCGNLMPTTTTTTPLTTATTTATTVTSVDFENEEALEHDCDDNDDDADDHVDDAELGSGEPPFWELVPDPAVRDAFKFLALTGEPDAVREYFENYRERVGLPGSRSASSSAGSSTVASSSESSTVQHEPCLHSDLDDVKTTKKS